MRYHWHRYLLAAAASGMMLLGLSAVVSGAQTSRAVEQEHTIEILDSGFNPELCLIARSDDVRWVNKSSAVKHVVGTHNTNLDTGELQPGEASRFFSFDFTGSVPYELADDPTVKGSVKTDSPRNCKPQPPTPTPTNTPLPTPTAPPTPEGRRGVFPGVTRDGRLENTPVPIQ
jgi:plastocyanin